MMKLYLEPVAIRPKNRSYVSANRTVVTLNERARNYAQCYEKGCCFPSWLLLHGCGLSWVQKKATAKKKGISSSEKKNRA